MGQCQIAMASQIASGSSPLRSIIFHDIKNDRMKKKSN